MVHCFEVSYWDQSRSNGLARQAQSESENGMGRKRVAVGKVWQTVTAPQKVGLNHALTARSAIASIEGDQKFQTPMQ